MRIGSFFLKNETGRRKTFLNIMKEGKKGRERERGKIGIREDLRERERGRK